MSKMISHAMIVEHRRQGSWRKLEALAAEITEDVKAKTGSNFAPVLGGGTRLMLALEHRISHDIDLFIPDPQYIGYITPRLNEVVEDLVENYEEGAEFVKLRVAPEGEIDFIASAPLLGLPTKKLADTVFQAEAVAEVLAKKLFYRGAVLTPRDLFDWWAVETIQPLQQETRTRLGKLLASRQANLEQALELLWKSANAERIWQGIQTDREVDLKETTKWASGQLDKYVHLARNKINKPNGP